jgi:predicted enzyme related to lactoylglutathione lyase
MLGAVAHFEIPVDDMTRAQAFYRDAFGWDIAEAPEMNYTLVRTVPTDESGTPAQPGGINGGMVPRVEPVYHPVITINVGDVDGALATIERLGGAVVQGKTPVGPIGFAAYAKDSEGNVFGLWQAAGTA